MIKMGRSPSKGKLIWGLVGGMTRGDSGKAYCRCRPLLASCVWSETPLKHSILHVFLVSNPLFFFVVTVLKKNTNKINTCIDWMMSIFCCSHVKEKISCCLSHFNIILFLIILLSSLLQGMGDLCADPDTFVISQVKKQVEIGSATFAIMLISWHLFPFLFTTFL